jgi:hypothetical protein
MTHALNLKAVTRALNLKAALEILAEQMVFTANILRKAAAAEAASPSDVEGILAQAQAQLDYARRMLVISDDNKPTSI